MGRLKRFAGFVWRWITVVIPVAVVVLTAASGVTNGHYHVGHHRVSVAWTLIVVAALLALVEAVIVARRQLRVGNLEAANAELEGRAIAGEEAVVGLMRAELIALQERARQFSSERVSLFRCDEITSRWSLGARRVRHSTRASAGERTRSMKGSSGKRGPTGRPVCLRCRHRARPTSRRGGAGSMPNAA